MAYALLLAASLPFPAWAAPPGLPMTQPPSRVTAAGPYHLRLVASLASGVSFPAGPAPETGLHQGPPARFDQRQNPAPWFGLDYHQRLGAGRLTFTGDIGMMHARMPAFPGGLDRNTDIDVQQTLSEAAGGHLAWRPLLDALLVLHY